MEPAQVQALVLAGLAVGVLVAYRLLRVYRIYDHMNVRVDVEWFEPPIDFRDDLYPPGSVYVAVTATNVGRRLATVTAVGLETTTGRHIPMRAAEPGRYLPATFRTGEHRRMWITKDEIEAAIRTDGAHVRRAYAQGPEGAQWSTDRLGGIARLE